MGGRGHSRHVHTHSQAHAHGAHPHPCTMHSHTRAHTPLAALLCQSFLLSGQTGLGTDARTPGASRGQSRVSGAMWRGAHGGRTLLPPPVGRTAGPGQVERDCGTALPKGTKSAASAGPLPGPPSSKRRPQSWLRHSFRPPSCLSASHSGRVSGPRGPGGSRSCDS